MNIWHLPGPSEYLVAVERSLRDGKSVVLRFPGAVPSGFETALHVQLADCWRWERIEVSPSAALVPSEPLRHLVERFAPELSRISDLTAVDLCEAEGFLGRLIWVDGLCHGNVLSWMTFLEKYSQASRGVSMLRRTMFVAPVGAHDSGVSNGDVGLMTHDWAGVIDEMDLAFLANDRLRTRGIGGVLRELLIMTVARVAAWDVAVADWLSQAREEDILDPLALLQSAAEERGWTCETPSSVSLGTESCTGMAHAAHAAVSKPDEIQRRVWSAQVSVLLPVIEVQRREIVREHRHQIDAELRRANWEEDAESLEIGQLAFLLRWAALEPEFSYRVENLRLARNSLAHGQPLSTSQVLTLVRGAAHAPVELR